MKILQLFDPATSTYTYLLWDDKSKYAAIIDSVLEQTDRDSLLIQQLGLTLRYSLETHIHADHVTGSGILRDHFGCTVAVHKQSEAECADQLLEDGNEILLGEEIIEVLYTPGHTNTDISYKIKDAVFTGDALLINGCGRTDFQSGDAITLYRSITQRLFTLHDDTTVYPGHDYTGQLSTTIGREKKFNPRLGNGKSEQEFVKVMNELVLDPPARIDIAVPGNQLCGIKQAS